MIYPDPKPPKREKAKRAHNSTLPVSKPRKACGGATMQRSSMPKRKTSVRPVNPERAAEAFAYGYHSKERKAWVKQQPCVMCEMFGPPPASMGPQLGHCDNAHTGKKPGKGLKSHYTTVVPACRPHHTMYDDRIAPFDQPEVRERVEARAPEIEAAWRAAQGVGQ